MKDLEFLRLKAHKYDLVADYINETTLKVYSPKYLFDSWLIVETEDAFELMHQSKMNGNKKCSYHLHATVSKSKKHWLLERIEDHNRYVAFYKNNKKINLVDRILSKQSKK